MPAYVIAYLEVTDPDAFQVYRMAAGPTFAPYGGKPIVVDGQFEVLEGMTQPRSIIVVEFESMEQARRWSLDLDHYWCRQMKSSSDGVRAAVIRAVRCQPVAS